MGLASSLPEESAYAPFQALGLGYTEELVRSYKERDLDFGIDLPTVEALTGVDAGAALALVDGLSRSTLEPRLINALALLCGVCLAGSASSAERAGCIYDVFDFDQREELSQDELTILLLCASRAALVVAGAGDEPQDDMVEAAAAFAFEANSSGDTIKKAFGLLGIKVPERM